MASVTKWKVVYTNRKTALAILQMDRKTSGLNVDFQKYCMLLVNLKLVTVVLLYFDGISVLFTLKFKMGPTTDMSHHVCGWHIVVNQQRHEMIASHNNLDDSDLCFFFRLFPHWVEILKKRQSLSYPGVTTVKPICYLTFSKCVSADINPFCLHIQFIFVFVKWISSFLSHCIRQVLQILTGK